MESLVFFALIFLLNPIIVMTSNIYFLRCSLFSYVSSCCNFQRFIAMAHLNESEHLSNLTNQTSHNTLACFYSSQRYVIIFIALIIGLMISLTGNMLVVTIFTRDKTLRTSVNYFIVNIAISDVLISMTCLAPIVSRILYKDNRWFADGILGSILCKFTFYFLQVSRFVSMFSMMVIAAERYRAVLFPYRCDLISEKRRPFVIAGTWILAMAIPAHNLYGLKLVSYDAKRYCDFRWEPVLETLVLKISRVVFFCTITASAIVLTVLYTKISIHLYMENKTINLASEAIKERAKLNRQVQIMLAVTVILFYACWIPVSIISLIEVLKGVTLRCDAMYGPPIQIIYTLINPLIYYAFNEHYRQGFKELLCCCCKCNSTKSNNTVSPIVELNIHQRENGDHINKAAETNKLQITLCDNI